MSILDQIAEDEKRLAELQGDVNGDSEEVVEEEAEEVVEDDTTAEEPTEEATEETADTSEVEEPVEKLDNSAYAKMRREKAEAEKRARDLEARLEALEKGRQEPVKEQPKDAEPNIKTDPVAWLEWNDKQNKTEIAELKKVALEERKQREEQQIIEQAKQEFTNYEQQFAPTVDNYEDVAQFMFKRIAESMRIVNPSLSQEQLINATQRHILQQAAQYHTQGLNPAEELYHDAINSFGYQPTVKTQEPARRDLSKVAANRKRNAGTMGVGGGNKPQITKEMAATMSIADFAKLSKEDLKAIGM
jgi:hypothetical protein